LHGSPNCFIDRTFISTFSFPHKVTKSKTITRIYRNSIYLAKGYKEMVDSDKVKNQADLARLNYISRPRVTQIVNS